MSVTSSNTNRVLHFDCFSGASGDMILSALINLGVPLETIESSVRTLPLEGYQIKTKNEKRQSLAATRFIVEVDEKHQPHRHFSDIRQMLNEANLDPATQKLAIDIFQIIAVAEARAHGVEIDHVHFHEVGAVDSIVDIVGAARAITYLNARVTCSPVPVGNGTINTAHGVLPVPSPATLFILEGVPLIGTEIDAELTTPTGAAILKATAESFGPYPAMIPEKVGFGAGSRSHPTRPGLLRAVLGSTTQPGGQCIVIEANIDDITGEIAAAALNALLKTGALDAWIEPIQMKKGRPALKISALCQNADFEKVVAELLRQTPTIGLRHYPVGRVEMERSIHTVETPFGPIRVKLARGPGQSANVAPEFEDCRQAAETHNVQLKQVMAVAAGLAQSLLD